MGGHAALVREQGGLQDQALDRADEQHRRGLGVEIGRHQSFGPGRLEQAGETLTVAADKLAQLSARPGAIRLLEFVEEDAGNAGMGGHEAHMGMEDPFEGVEGIASFPERAFEGCAEGDRQPGEDAGPDGLLVGEMAEQGAMGHADPLGDGLGGHPGGPDFRAQGQYGLDDGLLAFAGGQALSRGGGTPCRRGSHRGRVLGK